MSVTDQTDHVLAAIDGAVRDYELSSDAMRWVPEDARDDEPRPDVEAPAWQLAAWACVQQTADRINDELLLRGQAFVAVDPADPDRISFDTRAAVAQLVEFQECTATLRAVRHPLTEYEAHMILLRHQSLGFTPTQVIEHLVEHGETPEERRDRLVAKVDRVEIVRHEPELIQDWGQALLRVEAELPDGRRAHGRVIVRQELMDDAEHSPELLEREWQAAEQQLRDYIRGELQATENV